jgi:hypothetical protein
MSQKFKGDETELKFEAAGSNILDALELQLDAFEAGAYTAAPLGDVLYDTERTPLANAIDRTIFRNAYPEIYEAFTVAGSFESYLSVFAKIFGDEVDVTFTVPAPGKLEIDIIADEVILSDLVSRYIADGQYNFDEIVDYDGDNVAVQTIKGFQNPYELEQMLYEMVPDGIWTSISLTFGE